jgi:hypothetical protein
MRIFTLAWLLLMCSQGKSGGGWFWSARWGVLVSSVVVGGGAALKEQLKVFSDYSSLCLILASAPLSAFGGS